MIYLDLERIYKETEIPNKYILTLVVASRARQLSLRKDADGASEKYISQALNELTENKITYKVTNANVMANANEPLETR